MPYAIDEEKLNSPDLKVLDISKPPLKAIPHLEFPQMVYLHPKDRTKEHRTKIVHTPAELDSAQKQGYKTTPHIPEAAAEDLSSFEIEYETPRGPGRPKVA